MAAVACLQADLYTTSGQSTRGGRGLRSPTSGASASTGRRIPRPSEVRGGIRPDLATPGRPPDRGARRPAADDGSRAAARRWMSSRSSSAPASFTDENLLCLLVARLANLSLEHGNSDGSCLGLRAASACSSGRASATTEGRSGSASSASTWWRSARPLRFKARVYLDSESHQPLDEPLRRPRAACAAPSKPRRRPATSRTRATPRNGLITLLLARGDPLGEVQREAESALDVRASRRSCGLVVDWSPRSSRLIRMLRGLD